MRINSSHSLAERDRDAYFTPPEATRSLIALEQLPHRIWEPCCGDGAIVNLLRKAEWHGWIEILEKVDKELIS
jgi:hypothetical protein